MDAGTLGLVTILSVVAVPLVSLIKNEKWSTKTKFLVSVVLSLIVGAGVTLTQHPINDWHQLLALSGDALAVTQIVYHTLFKDNRIDQLLTAVGVTTTDVQHVVTDVKSVVDSTK